MAENKKPGFFDAPPQTMFFFGIVVGIALTLILQALFGNGMSLGSNNAPTPSAPTPSPSAAAPTPSAPAGEVRPADSSDWVRGDLDSAQVVLIEYSDLQCAFCERFHPTLKNITAQYGDQVAWVYRHFPLTSIHNQAEPAANAAECVGDQVGSAGFFAFIDEIFEGGAPLNKTTYMNIARSISGVNMNQFENCVDNMDFIDRVRAQQQGGVSAGVQGTPATFVNGQLVSGAVPEAQLASIIDSLIQ